MSQENPTLELLKVVKTENQFRDILNALVYELQNSEFTTPTTEEQAALNTVIQDKKNTLWHTDLGDFDVEKEKNEILDIFEKVRNIH